MGDRGGRARVGYGREGIRGYFLAPPALGLERAPHRCRRDPGLFRNAPKAGPALPAGHQLGVVDHLPRPPQDLPLGPGIRQRRLDPLPHERPLELGVGEE